jgi:GNAT superfamily N-acetyltransferase
MSEGDLRLETVNVPRMGGTPVYGVAVTALAALIEVQQFDPTQPAFLVSDSAIVARVSLGDSDHVVGIITYSVDPIYGASIGVAFVHPEYRRRGILRHMLEELVRAIGEGVRVRTTLTLQNVHAAKALVGAGFRVVANVYEIST